jgi:hypothetical protein
MRFKGIAFFHRFLRAEVLSSAQVRLENDKKFDSYRRRPSTSCRQNGSAPLRLRVVAFKLLPQIDARHDGIVI